MKSSEDKVEKELELALPDRAVKEIKKHPIIYIAASILAVVLITGLSIWLGFTNKALGEERNQVRSLNEDLEDSAKELEILKESLNKTEEGKKQVEDAKNKAEAESAAQGARAQSAEASASRAKSDLNAAQTELNAKKSELEKVNKCITVFNGAKSTLNLYDQAIGYTIDLLGDAILDATNGYYDLAASDIRTASEWAGKADGYGAQLDSMFSKVTSGSC